jgi:hypothetical protein
MSRRDFVARGATPFGGKFAANSLKSRVTPGCKPCGAAGGE